MERDTIIELMNDPIAQELVNAPMHARLAHNAKNGSPRVIPIGYYWDGEAFVMDSPTNAPKIKALAQLKNIEGSGRSTSAASGSVPTSPSKAVATSVNSNRPGASVPPATPSVRSKNAGGSSKRQWIIGLIVIVIIVWLLFH